LHLKGKTKRIYFARSESKEKNYREETKLAHITRGYQPI
jgi:hypothetical protein